jgi:CheY-like chemotaxis protein
LPIIAMTAHAMAAERQKCLDAGMNDHVSKPFEPATLFEVLARWLQPTPLPLATTAPAPAPAGGAMAFDVGLRRCLGRRELYERLLRRYLEANAGTGAALRQALLRGETGLAASTAHSVVSTAGTVGAEVLAEAARALELAWKSTSQPTGRNGWRRSRPRKRGCWPRCAATWGANGCRAETIGYMPLKRWA